MRRDKPEKFDSPFYLKRCSNYVPSLPEGELQPFTWDGATECYHFGTEDDFLQNLGGHGSVGVGYNNSRIAFCKPGLSWYLIKPVVSFGPLRGMFLLFGYRWYKASKYDI